jgi:hypothetical protein
MILGTLGPVSSVRRRGDRLHNKRGEAIPGTDVTHFFSLSPKVGQRQADCRAISVDEISNGSPGWIRTAQAVGCAAQDRPRVTCPASQPAWLSRSGPSSSVREVLKITVALQRADFPALST